MSKNKKIKKCLFPAAGYGTRFLPATKAIPKEMLPVLTKPLLQYGVEEAISAGCETMAIVTGRGKRAIEDHFDISYELEHQIKGTAKEHYLTEIRDVITNCTFSYTRQIEMKGLGHAILCGETLIGDEPFAVILADDLCDNDGDAVLSQMIKLYEKYQCSIVAVEEIPAQDSNKYGVIAGDKIPSQAENDDKTQAENDDKTQAENDDKTQAENEENRHPELVPQGYYSGHSESLFRVTNMVEKPEPEDAPSNLAIIGRYILTPDIFDIIRDTKPGKGGEIQITDALLTQAKAGNVIAYKFKGKRFDCGSVDGFVQATNYFYDKSNK
ncbi:MAG: UTP--glucose-1-phosphate uridylyltransferase [Sulfurimonas sp.]|nr:MAG: UTP--glucose-1-phosphate uridylyltransferase [Sulfurimonas sp.]